jgi:predicted Zn-dependent peptidase
MAMTTLRSRDIETTTLSNGVKVITETMPHVRSASVGIWVATGSRREKPNENGISHFLEHMLFKGTTSRSAEDIARSVDSIGGNLDAFTAKELVSYNTKVLDEHLPLAFDILSDLVLNPMLRAEDVEKEKGVILEELKMEVDNPEYLVHEIFASRFWKGHALGRPILGTKATVQSFQPETLRAYHRAVYTPENIIITAAGNLRHEQIARLAERFTGLEASSQPLPEPPPVPQAAVTLKNKRSLQQVHLCLGVPSFPSAHPMRFPSYVLNTLLGGGMSSRLFQNIRERQGLVYAVFSELSLYRDTGCLAVYAGTSIESTPKVVTSVLNEFRHLKDELVSGEELRRAKDHLKGSLMLGLESTSSRMANLARQAIYFGRFFSLDEMVESIEEVTANQVREVARTFFNPEGIGLTILGRLNGLSLTREELAC